MIFEAPPATATTAEVVTPSSRLETMTKKKGKDAVSCLILLDSEVRSVRRIVNADSKRPGIQPGEQRVHEALKKIGLLNFLRTVWKWQEVGICSQFVANWNDGKKTTVVKDIEIDVSFQTFVMVTGLLAEESAMASDEAELEEVYRARAEKVWKRRDDMYSSICALSEVEVPWFRDLLILLSRTVWMYCSHAESLPVYLIDSVSEALSGRRLRWSEGLYSNFVCEINRLHSQSRQKYNPDGSLKELKTVGGPVMCFLYIHAKLKAEALAELSAPLSCRQGETLRASTEYHEEESLPGENVPRPEVTDGERSKQDQVPSAPFSSQGVAVSHSDHPPKKGKSRRALNQDNEDNHPSRKRECGEVLNQDNRPRKKVKSRKVLNEDDHPPKKGKSRKVLNQDKDSISLPGSPPATEDLAAKVLELECVIARQNAELAESRLRLYLKGAKLT